VSALGERRGHGRRRRETAARMRPRTGRAESPSSPRATAPLLPVYEPWLRSQAFNSARHAAALRPFARGEFGTGIAAPSEGHIQAANELIVRLRAELIKLNEPMRAASLAATREPNPSNIGRLLALKERAHRWVRDIERVWSFYFELFGQRQSRYGEWLIGCDRIALDSFTAAFRGIAIARSIPAPPPFAYMKTGFSPATYRRGVPLSRIGRLPNPFPLVELPYHRLVNPWTLGAVLHEVSHNLQNDLGLDRAVPVRIQRRLSERGHPASVVQMWTRWNRETFADISGLLLGGPAIVASLMDVIGRSPAATYHFNPDGVHPTPYLRTLISVELLRRMGFGAQAERYDRAWRRLYADPRGAIPAEILRSFPASCRDVVDVIGYSPYKSLGGRSLSDVYRFAPKDQLMIEEAARRLAAGTDPGVVPARFLIGAARVAIDRRLARPGVIQKNFYTELARR
jgi:hypothetical protein